MPQWWQEAWANLVFQDVKNSTSIRKGREATIRNIHIKEGDFITIDGSRGEVYLGEVPTVDPEISEDLLTLLSWADEIRTMGVRANADTPEGCDQGKTVGGRRDRPLPNGENV